MNEQVQTRPRKPFYRYDPFVSIIITFAIYIVSQIIAAILVGLYPALQNWTEEQASRWLADSVPAQFFYTLIAEVTTIFMVLWLIKRIGVLKSRIGLVSPKLRDIGYALITYGMYFLAYLAVIFVAQLLLPSLDTEQKQQIGFESARNDYTILMTFLSLVVIVPITEEILFRGFLFSSLRAKMRFRYTVIITSVLFGILHLQFGSEAPLLWVAAIDTFVLSCFLCYLRERTGSLWSPTLLHAGKNLVAFVVLFGPRFI